MIATLHGLVTEKNNNVVIECHGVGYGVVVTLSDFGVLHTGTEAKLYIYEHIKEDAHDLYGFISKDTKQLFTQLLGVKNVGPKVALAVLDIGQLGTVRAAIAQGDVKLLQTAKGVGKRAAEQIVVELRDKMGAPVGDGAEQLINRAGINQHDEALQALVSLGYSEYDASAVLSTIDPLLSVEERIKLALKGGA
ncbi:Holliday junction branch migration protein RuvA [Candidatus Saccharibacteria bacterium]|nr:Holliday junction branch migration protein RuvA [Candidatus Saccharibacteria bacterium]